ncbi:amino acid adenylation domain-containing protein [Micromonospora echinofusca]|uniref:amino acid adenylation domain-containing protein n=1 Tax=Micromonospora echinofusca TaxID=47858 RepID=UPI003407C6BF
MTTTDQDRRRALVERLLAERGVTRTTNRITPRPDPAAPVPLSFAQQRLWLTAELAPTTSAYAVRTVLRLRGPIDAATLRRAADEVVRRHEALRTVIRRVDGDPVQVVLPDLPPVFAVDEAAVSGRPVSEAAALFAEDARLPFDLAKGPLLRLRLVRLDDGQWLFGVTTHHIVCDGWSLRVLLAELTSCYDALRLGRAPDLPPLEIQYGDYAAWERQRQHGRHLDRLLQHWRARMAGAPAVLRLPTDRPRPSRPSHRGATVAFPVEASTAHRLREVARERGATPFMVLLAAFATVLARYADTDDVVVGTPVANRSRRELEPLIGPFVNTLLLRTRVHDGDTFTALVDAVRTTATDAYEHQELAFERLVEELSPERDLSVHPLFQVMFAYDDGQAAADRVLGAPAEPVEVDDDTAKFDLTLLCADGPDGLTGRIEYSTDLFDPPTVERLAGHFRALLAAAVAAPETRLRELPMMGAAERHRVLHEWNDTDAPYPQDRCLHQLFEEQVARTPDRVALVGAESVTFAELDARANRLARHLVGLGAGPDVLVGICLERGVEMVVALLAVFKAGAAYVPLDPGYPQERLRFILDDTAATLLVTRTGQLARLPVARGVRAVLLDRDAEAIDRLDGTGPVRAGAPDDLAYVTYTSGSTGRPRGVLGSQRGMVNCVWWLLRHTPFEAGEVMAQRVSLNFLDVVWEIFAPLLSGAPVVVFPNDVVLDVDRFVDAMGAARISRLVVVPSLLRELLAGVDLRRRLPDLRYVFTSGEALPADLAERFATVLPGVVLMNLYGTSEVSADVSHHTLVPGAGLSSVPIGRPLSNMRLYVLDRHRDPVPVGVPGELYVGGIGLARGYLGLPGETAQRFLPDPFGGQPGGRLYRTGDLVRLRADGELDYLGRTDDQVKIRGFRIEPGEIEAALNRHPAVEQSVVVDREQPSGGRALVAFVVPRDGSCDVGSLRQHLRDTLPEHMVPTRIGVLDELPMTPSGKVRRAALPVEVSAADTPRRAAPEGTVECALAAMWASVLDLPVERIGRDDNFFHIGGHSLMATRLVNMVRQTLAEEVPLRLLFERPTVRGLAAALGDAGAAPAGDAEPPLVPVDRGQDLPLSFAQQRLWFFEQLRPTLGAYNVRSAFELRGRVAPDTVRQAVRTIVERHEVLRTRFPTVRGVAAQVVDPVAAPLVGVEDVRGLPVAEQDAAVRRVLDEESATGFDLATGPLLRVRFVRLSDESAVLIIVMHHIVCDAWSLRAFAHEFLVLADASTHQRPAQLPDLPVQYADYAQWQRRLLDGTRLETQLGYWRDRLGGAPPVLPLRTDRPRPAQQTFAGASLTFRVPAELVRGVDDLRRRHDVTLYMVMLAAFDVVLAARADTTDVIVGTPVANRTRPEIEPLIGFFVNTLVLRTRLDGDPPFGEVLDRVRQTALGAYQHQDIPFERLVRELKPPRGARHTPVFQVMFNLINRTEDQLEVGDLRLTPIGSDEDVARYDLSFIVWEGAEELDCQLVYNVDLFDVATAEDIASDVLRVLRQACADPHVRLSHLLRGIGGAR